MHESPWIAEILSRLATYGYPLLLAAAVAENLFVIGLLVPGDLVVLVSGVLAEQGVLSLPLVILCAGAGSMVGANLSFALGVQGGAATVARWGERVGVGPSRIAAVERYFQAHGAKTVFLASFVAGIKNLVPVVAGVSRMSYGRFFAWSAAGCTARAAIGIALGYVLGANLPRALAAARDFNGWTLAGFGVVVIVVLTLYRRRSGGPSS